MQLSVVIDKISRYFNGNLSGKIIAVWGVAFKENTDDIRESPSCVLIDHLLQYGARVQVYDPKAMKHTKEKYREQQSLSLFDDKSDALKGADALAIMTDWHEFKVFPINEIIKYLSNTSHFAACLIEI